MTLTLPNEEDMLAVIGNTAARAVTTEGGDVATIDLIDDPWMGEDIPEAVLKGLHLELWHCLVKQIGIKRKKGSILLPDQVVHDQEWTHGLCMVVHAGPAAYRGKKFEDLGIKPEDAPKPGELYLFTARSPERIKVNDQTFILVPDDALKVRVERQYINDISFKI